MNNCFTVLETFKGTWALINQYDEVVGVAPSYSAMMRMISIRAGSVASN
jgi:hypothetical protein